MVGQCVVNAPISLSAYIYSSLFSVLNASVYVCNPDSTSLDILILFIFNLHALINANAHVLRASAARALSMRYALYDTVTGVLRFRLAHRQQVVDGPSYVLATCSLHISHSLLIPYSRASPQAPLFIVPQSSNVRSHFTSQLTYCYVASQTQHSESEVLP